MKKKLFLGVIGMVGLLSLAGCAGSDENAALEENGSEAQESQSQENESQSQEDETEQEDENFGQLGDGDTMFSSQKTYQWQEITVSVPDFWEGRYHVEESEDGFAFVQTASSKKVEGMGMLCGFYRVDGTLVDIAGATPLAYTDTQTYYLQEPTDVNYYYEDADIAEEYHAMQEFIKSVAAAFDVAKEGVCYNPDEFIFPLSDKVLLKEEDLYNCSDDMLKIARNEIYARHGYMFTSSYLANYFDSCSWYEGTQTAETFQESELSQIEKDNVDLIVAAESAYQNEHPYPKEYAFHQTAKEDLDGNGTFEEISLELRAEEVVLRIDGREFLPSDYGASIVTPGEDVFYVTDISSYEPGLEIAILDDGPSSDFETHFFTYDGDLTYIGSVYGFPFQEISGYNGFSVDGTVRGETRLDFTHTCHAYDYWWYDTENRRLEYQDVGYYTLVGDRPHALSKDVTVYWDQTEDGLKSVLSAQEKVFFLETDGKEWVLVKGKDGTKGYLHIVDGKIAGTSDTPQEIFSGLDFVD